MIDVSDGLVADLGHIARASGVVISVDPSRLEVAEPVAAAAAAFNADPLTWLLTGGDDHAVAATFSKDADLPTGFTVIGSVGEVGDSDVLDRPGVVVGGRVPRGAGGHDHFAG